MVRDKGLFPGSSEGRNGETVEFEGLTLGAREFLFTLHRHSGSYSEEKANKKRDLGIALNGTAGKTSSERVSRSSNSWHKASLTENFDLHAKK